MIYGALLLLVSGAFGSLGALHGLRLLWLWPAASFFVVGLAYLARSPAWLGKRSDGTLAPWATLVFAPYALLAQLVCAAQRLTREDAANEVASGLWVGRRPRAGELPETVSYVVDLTAELPADPTIRAREGYLCFPTLDGTPPDARALDALVERLREVDGVFVHCAAGHGRSAMVAAALVLARGQAGDAEQAEALLRSRRAGIRLSRLQREALRRWHRDRR